VNFFLIRYIQILNLWS